MRKIQLFLSTIALLLLVDQTAKGQNYLTWMSDRHNDELKGDVWCVVTNKYNFTVKFGVPEIGTQKSTKKDCYDKDGFLVSNTTEKGESFTYKNTYGSNGRIQGIDKYDSKGELVWRRKYSPGDKGYGYKEYNGSGHFTSGAFYTTKGKGYQGETNVYDVFIETNSLTNSNGYPTTEETIMRGYNSMAGQPSARFTTTTKYNVKGWPSEATTVANRGYDSGSILVEYTGYEYQTDGNWTKRFIYKDGKPSECVERIIMTEEEYAQYKQEERKKKEIRLAQELEAKKQADRRFLEDVKRGRVKARNTTPLSVSLDLSTTRQNIEAWKQNDNPSSLLDEMCTFTIDENGHVTPTEGNSKKNKDGEELGDAFRFAEAKPHTIHLDVLDSVACVPSSFSIRIRQKEQPKFQRYNLQFKYDKKAESMILKDDKSLADLSTEKKQQLINYVMKQPFMEGETKKVKVELGYAVVPISIKIDETNYQETINVTLLQATQEK